jgi:hypothetical protein
VLPFVWQESTVAVRAMLEQRSQTREAQFEVLRALAGLKGWTELRLEVDGRCLRISGAYDGPPGTDAIAELLPIIAAAFAELDEIDRVAVDYQPSQLANFRREQFPTANDIEPIRMHRIAELLAIVSRQDEAEDAIQEWLMPAAQVAARELQGAASGEHDPSRSAAYLQWVVARLENRHVDDKARPAYDRLIGELRTSRTAIGASIVALKRNDRHFIHNCEIRLREAEARIWAWIEDERGPSVAGPG